MSIASLGLIDTLNLNNVNLGSNAQSLNGTYANLSFSNDLDSSNQPSATYTIGIAPSTDPDIPNGLTLSVSTNNPSVIAQEGIIAILPTGGGNVGNGSITVVGGDAQVSGDLSINLQNANSLGTDGNGRIIVGSGGGGSSAYSWNLGNAIFGDLTFGDQTPFSQSYAIIDPNSRIVSIFLNVVLITVGNYSNQYPLLSIDTNASWTPSATGTLPPPTALFQSLVPANNTITTFAGMNLTNISTTPNFTPLCDNFYMSAYFVNSGLMNVRGLQQVSTTNGNRVVYSGIIQYPY